MDTMKFGHYTNAEGKREELEWNISRQHKTTRYGKTGTIKQLICKHFIGFYNADEVYALIESNKNYMDIQAKYANYMFDLKEQELIRNANTTKDKNVFKYSPFFNLAWSWQMSPNLNEYCFYEVGNPRNTCLQLCDFDKGGAIICNREGTPFGIKSNGTGGLVYVDSGKVLLPHKYGIRPLIHIFEED